MTVNYMTCHHVGLHPGAAANKLLSEKNLTLLIEFARSDASLHYMHQSTNE